MCEQWRDRHAELIRYMDALTNICCILTFQNGAILMHVGEDHLCPNVHVDSKTRWLWMLCNSFFVLIYNRFFYVSLNFVSAAGMRSLPQPGGCSVGCFSVCLRLWHRIKQTSFMMPPENVQGIKMKLKNMRAVALWRASVQHAQVAFSSQVVIFYVTFGL